MGAYRSPLILLRDEVFSSVTVSASVILSASSDGIRSEDLGHTLGAPYLCSYLCKYVCRAARQSLSGRSQEGYINASWKSRTLLLE